MPDHPNPNIVAALERLMQDMQHLVDHPRIQQRTWVASGKEWLKLLHIVHGELTGQRLAAAPNDTNPLAENDTPSILVEVNADGGQTFITVALPNVQQVEVYRGGEPGFKDVRGVHSGFVLKDGRKYLTSANEAQRIVDALRKRDEVPGNKQN